MPFLSPPTVAQACFPEGLVRCPLQIIINRLSVGEEIFGGMPGILTAVAVVQDVLMKFLQVPMVAPVPVVVRGLLMVDTAVF
jgi:hypothetical protein